MVSVVFFNDTATTEIYTLSLHDALPISAGPPAWPARVVGRHAGHRGRLAPRRRRRAPDLRRARRRSEEHTSELQSRQYLVCRLLLEKKNKNKTYHTLPPRHRVSVPAHRP